MLTSKKDGEQDKTTNKTRKKKSSHQWIYDKQTNDINAKKKQNLRRKIDKEEI